MAAARGDRHRPSRLSDPKSGAPPTEITSPRSLSTQAPGPRGLAAMETARPRLSTAAGSGCASPSALMVPLRVNSHSPVPVGLAAAATIGPVTTPDRAGALTGAMNPVCVTRQKPEPDGVATAATTGSL